MVDNEKIFLIRPYLVAQILLMNQTQLRRADGVDCSLYHLNRTQELAAREA